MALRQIRFYVPTQIRIKVPIGTDHIVTPEFIPVPGARLQPTTLKTAYTNRTETRSVFPGTINHVRNEQKNHHFYYRY